MAKRPDVSKEALSRQDLAALQLRLLQMSDERDRRAGFLSTAYPASSFDENYFPSARAMQ